jgi:undecaprenyl phosphate N,N'-diacetylbacillosamine 1-phosphate transferase
MKKFIALLALASSSAAFAAVDFNSFDANGDGIISKTEAQANAQLARLFDKLDTDKNGELLPDDKRLLRFGRSIRSLSLDELPQIFNVLKGEMSFIGPRPLLIEYLDRYNDIQKRRHNVKPGITGWAQVNGRNAISWEQKFEYDIWYVNNQSFWLDIKILWMTFLKVVKRSDISSGSNATMEKFEGSK